MLANNNKIKKLNQKQSFRENGDEKLKNKFEIILHWRPELFGAGTWSLHGSYDVEMFCDVI